MIFTFDKTYLLQTQECMTCDEKSSLELSDKYIKFGKTSLKWMVGENGKLCIDAPIGYKEFRGSKTDQRRESFVVWVYNEIPSNEKLIFEFGTDAGRETWFEFGLNFRGWRCTWVMFDRDMEGKASENMDKLIIKAPESMAGKDLYFAKIILSTPIDARHHTRNEQTPFVNLEGDTKANSHWMSLYAFYEEYKKFVRKGEVTDRGKADIKIINQRFYQYLTENKQEVPFEEIVKCYKSYEIEVNEGVIKGRSVNCDNIFAVLDAFDKKYYLEQFNNIHCADYFKCLYDMAIGYIKSESKEEKIQTKEMFIHMVWHLYDQGFGAGSGLGTVHHLGYQMKNYFTALYLMKDEIKEAGWLEEITEAMNWFSGLGRIFYQHLKADGVNMDVLNTLLEGMISSLLMLEDLEMQSEILEAFTAWLTFSCSPKEGIMGPFKYDGIGFHHGGLYPAYTRDGLSGLTPVVYLLRGTKYRLPEEQHELVKRAVMNFRLFSNREQFLLSVSGRHPNGMESFPSTGFKYMALAGSPDGAKEIDKDVAAAYLRLVDKETDPLVIQFKELGIEKEQAPTGNWAMNYAALGLHRRDEWLVGVRGHSRYLWANETYKSNNLYGRYITHGQIQIMGGGLPVNNKESGYYHDGWDWNSWPGTTTIHLPMDELKSDVRNVDTFSGFEEMLISDETYAGALDLEGKNGMFAMKLHEHPKYNGSHRARKSVFMFDDRVIALGSDIENTNAENPTRTTIFQNYLTDIEEPIFVNSAEEIKGLDYKHEMQVEEMSYLLDNNNNGYLVPEGQKVTITRANQESRHQQKGTKTEGEFAKAVIEHGKTPQGEAYEYMIAVDTSLEELEAMKERMKKDEDPIYTVLQKDRMAHIVTDHATNTTGYALFEANGTLNKGNIVGIDTPAMVMMKEEGEQLTLSVCDPDLRLYEGIDESQYDEEGNQIEVSIYSREWMENESKMHTLQLVLMGGWKLASESTGCRVVGEENGNTTLAIDCKDGTKVEVILEKR
ncbi:MAG: chondroitinase family polysaccharide lyase [Cellulosilyticaceae bacterium]